MPNTAYETGNTSKLLDQITHEFNHMHISKVNRKYFNEEKGMPFSLHEVYTVQLNTAVYGYYRRIYWLICCVAVFASLDGPTVMKIVNKRNWRSQLPLESYLPVMRQKL